MQQYTLKDIPEFSSVFPLENCSLYQHLVSESGCSYFCKNSEEDIHRFTSIIPQDFCGKCGNFQQLYQIFVFLQSLYPVYFSCGFNSIENKFQEQYYSALKSDENKIKTEGLVLKDVLTDEVFTLKDANFSSCWASLNDFQQSENCSNSRMRIAVADSSEFNCDILLEEVFQSPDLSFSEIFIEEFEINNMPPDGQYRFFEIASTRANDINEKEQIRNVMASISSVFKAAQR